ncbi:Alpha/Beta hydrolase protein [Exophiala viscosa]|uniref:Alpha/Beta hydrolase protein n=1 Tax=Exophiala viscosa TaxID=2486360 RepID=A0AAN6DQ86_9EURO|nr:Alpha/Beta hydrolase protein [Exophiala viscosa]
MILGPINGIDCVAFVIFLIPQLIFQVDWLSLISVLLKVVSFLVIRLPYQLVQERYFAKQEDQSPFTQHASLFQDVVIRCVRYAFAKIPASVGRVFFSKGVALPFFRFRLLRHGHIRSPIFYKDIIRHGARGLWIIGDPDSEPDIIIYYAHGGGFSMGSAYFYMEFLMAWLTRLKESGFSNPAVFALEYTLVPDAQWPTQFNETRAGYKFLREAFGDGSAAKICVSGDSAGATLILSMLLQPGELEKNSQFRSLHRPGLAILLSPWTHLVSELNQNTPSDYLDRDSLHLYAKQYAGNATRTDGVISPGLNTDRWKQASPLNGYRVVYGAEEVFQPGISEMVHHMKKDGAVVKASELEAGIHAWPVVSLFLGETREERLQGLDIMTDFIMSSSLASSIGKTT